MIGLRWEFQPAGTFAEFGAAWDEFNARTFKLPLLSSPFVGAALRHFGNGQTELAIASDGRGTAALCLLRMRGTSVVETFQPSQLPVGPWLQRPDVELADLASSLVHRQPTNVVLASLTQLDPLHVPRPRDAGLFRSLPYIATGSIELPAAWDGYMSSRSENLLANLRRRQHKVEREHGAVTLEVCDADSHTEAGMGHYSDLESVGWKAKRGTALVRGNRQWQFYCETMASFCREKRGRIYVLRFGDTLAAACLAVIANGTAYLLKTTHNEKMKSVAPGMMLRRQFIESLYRREPTVRRIEIYGALNESQRPWITGVREMYHANAYRGPVIAALHSLSRRMKQPFRAIGQGTN
jgi:CelD/BcsL family acetyltransferase involved in cellulose biosynthesis